MKVIIIGGGASGMVAAITAARKGHRVTIIEKNKTLGKKILATGNGKCNFSNLNAVGYEEILEFFSELGVLSRIDDSGRIYPMNEQAVTILNALIGEMKRLEVQIILDTLVRQVNSDLTVLLDNKTILNCDKIIIATGGYAAKQFGNTGDGYYFAKNLGHSIIKPMPSLVGLQAKEAFFKQLKGVRSKAKVSLFDLGNDGKFFVESDSGEIQFTESGISGICVMNLSKYVTEIIDKKNKCFLSIDFANELSEEALVNYVQKIHEGAPDISVGSILSGIVNSKLGKVFSDLSNGEFLPAKMAVLLKDFEIEIIGTKDWEDAQVTTGGIPLYEVNMMTMESLKAKGVFFTGEILDYDGPCGGYNLHWAWKTGIIAGSNLK